MPFNQKLQKFNAKINTVTIGSGDKTVTIGGDSTYPFYSFDAPSENAPKIGVEISDMGLENIVSEGIKAYYDGASTIGEMAKKAAAMEGADFVALILEGGDPNGVNKSVDELIAVVKEVADAIDAPLVVEGCKNVEKDAELLPKVAEALQGRNVLILSEKEENYKAIGAAAGLAYDQIVGAESAVDINLAKQLNVVTTQLGVNAQKIVMNIGSAAAGYGYEYVVSTMDRIKGAALSQNDNMLQMPIITPVSAETWGVKEATASEKDMPEWGPEEERGIDMEVMTAAADLAAGSDAVILRHPEAVAAISRMIKMALNGIQIFKLTPKKNCKECGCPTCMAFSMKVAQGAMKIEQCPHMSDEALASLSEATAPPMKTIKIGTGAEEHTLGGETVLFRHEKTFVSKPRYAVALCTCMDDAAVEAKLAEIPKVDYDRIGERMYAELVYVNCGEGADAAKYTALVEKAAGLGRTLVLDCKDPEIAKAALAVCKDSKPVLNGADASNYEAMNAVATEAGVVLGVSGKDLNELYDTTAALEKLGNKNLVLDTTGADIKETFANTVQVRRAALKDQDRTFGYLQ